MGELKTLAEAIALVVGPDSEFGATTPRAGLSPFWFRGQSDAAWKLEPGVFRTSADGEYIYDEYNMMGEMRLLNSEEARRCTTTVEWLVLTQHYGLPTRLLDWTESILVALYFASLDDNVDGRLFVLHASALNQHTSLLKSPNVCVPNYPDAVLRADQSLCGSYEELWDRLQNSYTKGEFFARYLARIGEERFREVASLPVAVYPPRNNPRITSQSGMFTLHGGDTASASHRGFCGEAATLEEVHEEAVSSKQRRQKDPRILRGDFLIPKKRKRQIRHDLARLGVHQAALFPEFEYQARHIRQKWSRL